MLVGGLAGPVHAATLDGLMQQVRSDADYKVRLSAALALGKRGDRRAVAALVDALADRVPTIRAVSAGALSKLIDNKVAVDLRARAQATLSRLAKEDPQEIVRDAAARAVRALERVKEPTPPADVTPAYFVDISKVGDESGKTDAATLKMIAESVRQAIRQEDPSIATTWPGKGRPTAKALKRAGIRGAFFLKATVSRFDVDVAGRRAKVTCKLKFVLATYPEQAIRGFIKGGAQVETSSGPSAVANARRDCMKDLVKHLVHKQIVPDVHAKAR